MGRSPPPPPPPPPIQIDDCVCVVMRYIDRGSVAFLVCCVVSAGENHPCYGDRQMRGSVCSCRSKGQLGGLTE